MEENLKLTKIDDLNLYLTELESNCELSLKSTLNTQLQVIKFVSSPELNSSVHDLIFKNLQKSLKATNDEIEKEEVRELYHLMIHNYIFFANAKIAYAINKNKEESLKILQSACEELVYSCQSVINQNNNKILAMTKPQLLAGPIAIDFIQRITKKNGLWESTMNLMISNSKSRREQETFIKSIDDLLSKLNKYYNIIGPSNLLSDIVDRYTSKIIELKTELYKKKSRTSARIYKPLLILGVFSISSWLLMSQFIYRTAANSMNYLAETNIPDESQSFNSAWITIGILFVFLFLVLSIPTIRLNIKINKLKKEYKELSLKYVEQNN